MSAGLKILKKCAVVLFTISYFYGCTTPEERAMEMETKTRAKIKVHTVVIQQMKFMPAELTVSDGDTVTWINRDIVDHNVTAEPGKEWTSGNLRPGKSWSMVVAKSAAYFCSIHPVMKGSLSVR